MIHQHLSRSLLFGLAFTTALTGCVTAGDLNKLESRLSEQLQQMESRTQPLVGSLRTELAEVRTAQDSLRDEVVQGFSKVRGDTKDAREAMTQSQASLVELQRVLQAEIAQNRKALSQYAGQSAKALQLMADHTKQATREMEVFRRGMMHSLLGSYQAEEASLRERLNALVRTRQQLESLAGPVAVEAPESGGPSDAPRVSDRREALVLP